MFLLLFSLEVYNTNIINADVVYNLERPPFVDSFLLFFCSEHIKKSTGGGAFVVAYLTFSGLISFVYIASFSSLLLVVFLPIYL